MTVQEFLGLVKVEIMAGTLQVKPTAPRIVCMDGTSLSVQAGEFLYCSPRQNVGPYYSVEVGYPSRVIEELLPYMDGGDDTDPTATVYGYVPIELVEQIVENCGGICEEITYLAKGSEAYL